MIMPKLKHDSWRHPHLYYKRSPYDDLRDLLIETKARREAERNAAGARPRPPSADDAADRGLEPIEAYLVTGRKLPEGTPRQSRWARDLKTRARPGLVPAPYRWVLGPSNGDV